MGFIFNIICLLFLLNITSRIIRFNKFSPIYIYIIFHVIVVLLSIGYFYFYKNKFSLYNLDYVSSEDFLYAIDYYILGINSFLTAVIVCYDLSSKPDKILLSNRISTEIKIKISVNDKLKNITIGYFFIIVIFFLLVYGKSLFIREEYISFEKFKGMITIIKLMSFLGCVLSALIYKENKMLSVLLFSILLTLYLGTGSRICFIFLVIYILITYFLSKNFNVLRKIKLFITLFLSFLFLAYVMQLRTLEDHGVIPYITYFFMMGDEVLEAFMFNIYYILIYGVFVTIGTLKTAAADWNIILTNISPMPGFLTNWYELAPKRRINLYAPYSTHGEVFKMGKWFSFIFFFWIGIMFSFFEKKTRKILTKGGYFKVFILIILLILHIFYAYEYNMRSSVRYIYYAFAYLFILYILEITPKYKR
jgi:hypothetical protein